MAARLPPRRAAHRPRSPPRSAAIRHARRPLPVRGRLAFNLAAAAGDTNRTDRFNRVLARPRLRQADAYHADRITELRAAQLGELQARRRPEP